MVKKVYKGLYLLKEKMEILTQCQSCKQKIARYICALCGSNVCDDCYNVKKGVCNNCTPKMD